MQHAGCCSPSPVRAGRAGAPNPVCSRAQQSALAPALWPCVDGRSFGEPRHGSGAGVQSREAMPCPLPKQEDLEQGTTGTCWVVMRPQGMAGQGLGAQVRVGAVGLDSGGHWIPML